MKNYVDGNICHCCMLLLANGEECEEFGHGDYPLMALLENEDVTPNCEEDCGEGGFEYGCCDGCGRYIGGTLHRIAIWGQED